VALCEGDAGVDDLGAGGVRGVDDALRDVDDAAALDLGAEERREGAVRADDVVLPVAGEEGCGGLVEVHGGFS
jgi:hypothetical protein